ncbi:cysteine-rich CWC family protein [Pseudomonas sp.]|uniref:cysteine-rich CWC family protein n=1 Tax=Pseudomonas sp. TaxID=306 RepID=UPI001B09E099|nr:cysteine-rich CWC family protein [Pseudomonas sp.]MBO9548815.1 cysteine-rich CWC family protein [Pseudomonas sp.]
MNDSQHCPACGALNQCSLADPRSATQACWCYGVTIDPAVLQALPAELRDKACLCPRCAAVEDQLVGAGAPAKKPAPL